MATDAHARISPSTPFEMECRLDEVVNAPSESNGNGMLETASCFSRHRLLVVRCFGVVITVLNAHSQVLCTSFDPKPNGPHRDLIGASLGVVVLLTLLICGLAWRSGEKLAKQLGPAGSHCRGMLFAAFLGLSLASDVAGLILTVILGQRVGWDLYEYLSNLAPPLLSLLSTTTSVFV